MNSMLKKSIVLGTIVFMILASVSTTTGTIIKSSNVIEPLGNEPVINITLPDAHLYYHPFKFRYADVEFDNPNEIIDVNLSGVFPGIIELAFSQEIYVHIQNQNTPIKFSYVQGLRNEVETIGGGAETGYIGPDSAWMGNFSISIYINESDLGTNFLDVCLTGVPPRLKFLATLHLFHDVLYIFDAPLLFKIFGGEVTYQLDIHT